MNMQIEKMGLTAVLVGSSARGPLLCFGRGRVEAESSRAMRIKMSAVLFSLSAGSSSISVDSIDGANS